MFVREEYDLEIRNIKKLHEELGKADAIIIGAGSGLSTAAGFSYTGERFQKCFKDFAEQYGITDMYSGGFYPFKTLEEYWAWWSRQIYYNRYVEAPNPVYDKLLSMVREKEYFVITTNVDHMFQKAGFDKKRLFYMQGDYGLWQCATPCHTKTYDNEEAVYKMMEQQKNMKVPSDLVPYCPVCHKPMTMNLRCDNTFVEDEGWHLASKRYLEFLNRNENRHVLFLELGTGMNTPSIIKYRFWQMAHQWRNATYACINLGEAYAPQEIEEKSICINEDIRKVLEQLQAISV